MFADTPQAQQAAAQSDVAAKLSRLVQQLGDSGVPVVSKEEAMALLNTLTPDQIAAAFQIVK